MSVSLACFATSIFDQSDWLKLLGIAGAVVALYFIARKLGSASESVAPPDVHFEFNTASFRPCGRR